MIHNNHKIKHENKIDVFEHSTSTFTDIFCELYLEIAGTFINLFYFLEKILVFNWFVFNFIFTQSMTNFDAVKAHRSLYFDFSNLTKNSSKSCFKLNSYFHLILNL
jgi:hypothetical protein